MTTIVGGDRNNGPGTTTRLTEETATPLWDLPVDKLETYLSDFAEPALDGVRGVQPLRGGERRGAGEGDGDPCLQQARRRRHGPARRPRALAHLVVVN